MKTSQSTNNKQPFRKYMQEKLAITVLVMMLALIALTVILYTMVQNKNEDYTQVVLSHQDYDSRTIPYRRGDIVDRNGSYLATSEKVYTLILDPKQMYEDDKKECVEPTIALLTELFGFDAEDLRSTITGKKDSSYIRYKKQMTFEEKEQFETESKARNEAFTKNREQKKILGVWFEDEYRRVYPNGSTACNVIGFAQKDGSAGSGGIEQYYNSSLVGNNGREYGYLTADSNLERVIKPAQNGNTVVSTIDLNIQKICEKYIDEWQAGIGSNVAAAIVMDPKTGEILAMDTSTRYDLNNPYDLSGCYSQEEINAMDDKAKSEAWYKMWRNFCVNDTYEPGSPQKAFTVAGAMEENIINGNETFQCNGFLSIGGHDIHCVSRIVGHGPTTVMQGLMKSCNVVMMNISRMEGVDIFAKYQSIFGFGQKTGIDLPGEADAASLIYTAENMKSADLATNSFGQNYNCTMIQMAAAYASMINGGSYYQPHVVKQILNEQGSVVDKKEPLLVRETISKETSDYINEALYQTVSGEGGTAGAAAVEGYEIAGKTGTAEKYPRSANNYLVSFIGYAPAHDPQVLCYVVIDTPHLEGKEQAHSTFASEIFSKIMAEGLPYMSVFPDGETAPADQEMADLPEGITSQNNGETEAPSEAPTNENGETYPVYDEEFIEEGVQYPELMPGDPSAESAPSEGQTGAPSQGSTEGAAPSQESIGAPSEAPSAESSASGNGGGAEKPSEAKADTNT